MEATSFTTVMSSKTPTISSAIAGLSKTAINAPYIAKNPPIVSSAITSNRGLVSTSSMGSIKSFDGQIDGTASSKLSRASSTSSQSSLNSRSTTSLLSGSGTTASNVMIFCRDTDSSVC